MPLALSHRGHCARAKGARAGRAEHRATLTVPLLSHGFGGYDMNNLIWLIGAIVIIIAILSFLGLR